MKKYLWLGLILMCSYGFSQEIPRNLNLAVKASRSFTADSLSIQDLTYYSKNFDRIFGPDLFTEDYLNYGLKAIYINPDYKMFYNDTYRPQHIFTVMPMAGVDVGACGAQPQYAVYSIENR
jgi:hypothetical protein